MKKRILLIFVICSVAISNSYCWNQIYYNDTVSFDKVDFVDQNIGYAISKFRIFKTINGGLDWVCLNYPETNSLQNLCFLNKDTGFVVGGNPLLNIILKTTDGGNNWTLTSDSSGSYLCSIYFVDSNVGYTGGRFGTFFKTTDCGLTWEKIVIGNYWIRNIFFTDEYNGYASVGNNYIIKTSDGGLSWSQQQIAPSGACMDIFFLNQNIGYCCNNEPAVYKTTDAGSTWLKISEHIDQAWVQSSLTKIYFFNENIGLLVNSGVICKTFDGGQNWFKQATNVKIGINDFTFIDENLGIAVGYSYGATNKVFVFNTFSGGGYNNNSEYIDVNNIKANVDLYGRFFEGMGDGGFEVPQGSGHNVFGCNNIWMGGKDSLNQIHLFGNYLSNTGRYLSSGPVWNTSERPAQIEEWSRLWRIKRVDIEDHILNWNHQNYIMPESILNWPGNGDTSIGMNSKIAPYSDFNGDGSYSPQFGDYPVIKGDEAIYLIINDKQENTTSIPGEKMNVEIHAMLYAFNCSDSALWNTIFLNLELINKSGIVYDSVYIGNYGYFIDGYDYEGTDVARGSYYNYSDYSDNNTLAYSAQSATILGGPYMNDDNSDYGSSGIPDGCDESVTGFGFNDGIIDNERMGLSKTISFCCEIAPQDQQQFYNYLKAVWPNGNPMRYNFLGMSDTINPVASFIYPGNPSTDPCGVGTGGIIMPGWTSSYSRNMGVSSIGPFTMQPESPHYVDIAFVYGKDYFNSTPMAGLVNMQQRIDSVRKYFITGQTPCGTYNIGVKENKLSTEDVIVFPNPANSYFDVKIGNDTQNNTIKIYSIEGNLVAEESFAGNQTRIITDMLSNGLYVVEISSENSIFYRKIIVTK